MEPNEMRRHPRPLDELTAARLAAGELDPSDAPPGYGPVARLLTEARAGSAGEDPPDGLLAAMVHAIESSSADHRNRTMPSKLRSPKIAALAAVAVLSSAGAAAAATGNLPEPAQDVVSSALDRVGVDVPSSNEDHPTGNTDNPTEADQHGVDVSEVARDKSTTGREHGAAVSEVARAGHGPDATEGEDEGNDEGTDEGTEDETERGKPADPGSQAPVDTPNSDHASDRAGLGSRNAGDHPNADDNPGTDHRP